MYNLFLVTYEYVSVEISACACTYGCLPGNSGTMSYELRKYILISCLKAIY